MTVLFLQIVNLSISASWLIAAVLVLRLFLKKAPRWISVLLWGLVAIRLVCPFPIESALSLLPSASTIPSDILTDPSPSLETGIPALDRVVNPVIEHSFAPQPAASANPLQILLPVLAAVWAAGVVLLAVYAGVSYLRLRRRVSTAVRLRDNIFQTEQVFSPFILGVFRPCIYLPFSLDETTLSAVIAHEQAHIRRRDHWWKPLGFLVLAVHWFNPLVWLSYLLLCRDIELACDEKVVREMGAAQRADYSQALLSCSVRQNRLGACPLAFGEVGVKERVKRVLHYRKPAVYLVAFAVVCCLATAVCFLTSPRTDTDTPPASSTDEPASRTLPLTEQSAAECIAQTLETLTLHSDGTVSFSLPEELPVSGDGKTALAVNLSATFSDAPGSYSVQDLLDDRRGWNGGERFVGSLESERGELVGVTLGVFFWTEVDTDAYQMYAGDSRELTAPFTYDAPAGYTAPGLQFEQDGPALRITCRMRDGSEPKLSFTLPEGISAAESDGTEVYQLLLVQEGEPVGSVTLYPFGASDAETLAGVDTAASSLPMQIFSPVALSNHAGYEGYQVQRSWDSGCTATAQYVWQDLRASSGDAASIPWQQMDCVLAYDWNVMPYFVEILLDEEGLAADIADSVQLVS